MNLNDLLMISFNVKFTLEVELQKHKNTSLEYWSFLGGASIKCEIQEWQTAPEQTQRWSRSQSLADSLVVYLNKVISTCTYPRHRGVTLWLCPCWRSKSGTALKCGSGTTSKPSHITPAHQASDSSASLKCCSPTASLISMVISDHSSLTVCRRPQKHQRCCDFDIPALANVGFFFFFHILTP